MERLDEALRKTSGYSKLTNNSVLLCFYTGSAFPENCEPMARNPEPPVGMPFGVDFPEHLRGAVQMNEAIHDGAVMIGRENSADPYIITGWSFRLFPPRSESHHSITNRGAAFNSCQQMSLENRIDQTFLISGEEIAQFIRGTLTRLSR